MLNRTQPNNDRLPNTRTHALSRHYPTHTGRQNPGFTLPEMLLALSIGSVIMLAAAQVYPRLRWQSDQLGQRYRLEQALRQLAFVMEKDLRRAGFCNGQCQGNSWFIGQFNGEQPQSCVIVSYDLNRNGVWEGNGSNNPESFGYRLRQGAIETQRGISDCQGNGWSRLTDAAEIRISDLSIALQQMPASGLFTLQLGGQWAEKPSITQHLSWTFAGLAL